MTEFNPEDFIQCERYKARLLKTACIRRQTEGISINESNQKAIPEGCKDCETGKKIRQGNEGETMAQTRRGKCDNCKREDMATQKRGIYGWICASCGGAIRGLNPSDAEKALAEKAAKYAGKGKMRKAVGEISIIAHKGERVLNRREVEEYERKPKQKKKPVKRKVMGKPTPDATTLSVAGKGLPLIEKIIQDYNGSLDQAEKIMALLISLKEYGVEFEMPDRHVMRVK